MRTGGPPAAATAAAAAFAAMKAVLLLSGRHQGSGGHSRGRGRCCGQQAEIARGQQRGGAPGQQAGHGQLGAPAICSRCSSRFCWICWIIWPDNSLVFLQGGQDGLLASGPQGHLT